MATDLILCNSNIVGSDSLVLHELCTQCILSCIVACWGHPNLECLSCESSFRVWSKMLCGRRAFKVWHWQCAPAGYFMLTLLPGASSPNTYQITAPQRACNQYLSSGPCGNDFIDIYTQVTRLHLLRSTCNSLVMGHLRHANGRAAPSAWQKIGKAELYDLLTAQMSTTDTYSWCILDLCWVVIGISMHVWWQVRASKSEN